MPATPQTTRIAPVMCGKMAIVAAFLKIEARERFHAGDSGVQLLHCATLDVFTGIIYLLSLFEQLIRMTREARTVQHIF
jgi:hypothetical protein